MISNNETTLQNIDALRIEHLSSLPEFQDLFLELQIPHAKVVELFHNGTCIGYAIIKERVMLEFSVVSSFQSEICRHFSEIIKICDVDTILVKSFDRVLMACCSRLYSYREIGLLYRDFTQIKSPKTPELSFRPAVLRDLPFLLMQEDEVFEPKDMLSGSLEKGEIILCLNGEKIVGCGFLTRIHPRWEYHDIGVFVVPEFRMQGFGTQIISYLIDICTNNNWIPVCGCGIDNYGSQRTLEKCGFVSRHRLLSFAVTKFGR